MLLSELIDTLNDIKEKCGDGIVELHSYAPNSGQYLKGNLCMARFYKCLNANNCVPTVIISSDDSEVFYDSSCSTLS
jgi:hypothetical protein